MLYMKNACVILVLAALLPACNKLDDYMLGKDNTPVPKTLEPIQSKVAIKEKWSTSAGSKSNDNFNKLVPVIAGNIIYSADHSGNVQANNKTTGALVWAKKLPTNLASGPVLAQGIIIVATSNSSLKALKQADGSELWQAKVSGDILSKPVITGNRVIAKSIDGKLYAFNLQNGTQLWVSEHGAPGLVLKASSSPVLMGNAVLVGYSDGRMDAVEVDSGRTLWQRSIAYATGSSDVERLIDIDADPIVKGNKIILGSYQGYIGALSLENGQFDWRKPASIYKNMAVRGNTLFFSDSNDVIWSINSQTGQVNWKQVALKARGLTEPVLIGNRLFVGDKTGMMHVLSTSNGEFLARLSTGGAVNVAPVVAGNNLYVMTANGKLNCYSIG